MASTKRPSSQIHPTEVHSAPLWHDDDDVADDIQVPNGKSAVFLHRSSDSGGCVPANEYQTRLRKAFQRQHKGTPKWAKLAITRSPVQPKPDDSDEEVQAVFDDMMRSSIRYVDRDPYLVKDFISTFRCPDVTIGHRDSRQINVVLFHRIRPVVITGGASGKVQLFKNVQFTNFPITSMSLMQGGCSVICGSVRQGYLMKYDLEKGFVVEVKLPKCIPPQNAGRFSLSNDGSLLAMIAHNSQVHVLSSSSMELIKTFSAPADVTSLQFFPGSNREIWAMTVGTKCPYYCHRIVLTIVGLFQWRNVCFLILRSVVKFSPNNLERGEVIIWNLSGSQQMFRDDGAVRGTKIRLSAEGDKVACGSNTGIVNLYDTVDVRKCTDPKPQAVLSNLLTSCDSIAFNHDGQLMAFSSDVKMSNVECVEFSPHSAYMGMGCTNGHLILDSLNYFENY
uniref:WD_REPEATS_REGION domain-containing protein n=1 Tax=Angiostrongylus cantonensis TaxID=6313 RepID=A0A0K0DEV6_ANGCA